jgi:hypothetical protein
VPEHIYSDMHAARRDMLKIDEVVQRPGVMGIDRDLGAAQAAVRRPADAPTDNPRPPPAARALRPVAKKPELKRSCRKNYANFSNEI